MTVLTVRVDSAVERALEYLLSQRAGETRSDVVREAILAAEKTARRARMREESAALRDDPEYQAEVKAVAADLDEIRAW
jgi:Arc/MetJ-type ribon-helix-helix transcriptional regulator